MIDCEPTKTSHPTWADVKAFRAGCEKRGLTVTSVYLTENYHASMGKPNLKGWRLWRARYLSSKRAYGSVLYTGDHDGRIWGGFGGVTPTLMQFASTGKITGYGGNVDVNAYRGNLDSLRALRMFKDYSGKAAPAKAVQPADNVLLAGEKAAQWAQDQSAHGPKFGTGWCLLKCRTAFGVNVIVNNAALSWRTNKRTHPTTDPLSIPAFVPVYWTGGSDGDGHIAISIGNGWCWSTDIKRNGYFDKVKIADIAKVWPKLRLVGWSEDLNGVTVYEAAKEGDWLDMATENEVKALLKDALREWVPTLLDNAQVVDVPEALAPMGGADARVSVGYALTSLLGDVAAHKADADEDQARVENALMILAKALSPDTEAAVNAALKDA